MTKSINQDSN